MKPHTQALYDVISISLATMMLVMIVGKAWDTYHPSPIKVACSIDVQYEQARVTYIGTGTIYN